MVRERKMSEKSFVWKKASLLLALLTVTGLVAPAASMAIDPPEQVVFLFLNRSIGKTPNINVTDPVCETPVVDGVPCTSWVINIESGVKSKRETLATLLTGSMKICDPDTFVDSNGSNGACKSYGVGSDQVKIQVTDLEGVIQSPVRIGTPLDPTKDVLAQKDEQIKEFRAMINALFNKNRFFARANLQLNKGAENTNRDVGIHIFFPRSLIQFDINDERDYSGYASFLAQNLFDLFLKTEVDVNPNPTPDDPSEGTIKIFTTSSRQ